MNRIDKLRIDALENSPCNDEFYYRFYKCYDNCQSHSQEKRYCEAFFNAFSNLTPVISDNELIVGKCRSTLSKEEETEWKNIYRPIAMQEFEKGGYGQDSHMAIDYELVLNLGLEGIAKKIGDYLAKCDESKKAFYNACIKCLEAVCVHSQNYADEAKRLAGCEKNPQRRSELEKIAQICKKVPAKPAENFYEAIQSVHFVTYALSYNPYRLCHQQFQLGHPDRYLLPYYLADIKNGVITKKEAQLLLDCLGIQINNCVPNGLSSGYMVGGRNESGKTVANELTLMGMQVIDDIRLVYPSVGLCYAKDMDESYLEKACEILSHGRSHPAIFNDDIIIKGLKSYGVPENEAHSYIHSTCVEITPVASSNVWVASPYTNMAKLLLDISDREYESFDSLLENLLETLDKSIKNNLDTQINLRKQRAENSMNPLLSCFVNDCLEKGLDIEKGGARYNWIMPSFVGMANLVDSLFARKTIVFENKEMSLCDFKAIVDSDFENNETLRNRILKTIPKYGNDIDEIDCLFEKIINHITSECRKYEGVYSNAKLVPSVFCWIMHERFGSQTGATFDGRKSGFPLGDGSGPCQGREMNGPTASVLSSTKWNHHKLIGGVAVNMKFSKKSLGPSSVETMKNLVKTYLIRGGFEMQINVVDKETLEKAILTPEEYRDLVVRIGGYSDYFVTLSPQMQQEVILRTEHEI